jgi:S1-C subfamily serine protease
MVKWIVLIICLIWSQFLVAKNSLPSVVKQVKSSIVAVGTFMPKRSPRAEFRGTGFTILDGKIVVTNAHVLPNALKIENMEKLAVFSKQEGKDSLYFASVIAVDEEHDIALLRLTEGRLPPLKISVEKVQEGELYAFTGFPIGMVLGLYPVTHRGIVSAKSPVAIPAIKSRHINTKVMKRLRNPYFVYQLDATAYPGNSGSPLYHPSTGKVVGIINKVFVKETKENVLSKPSGITYAIPIVHVRNLLKEKQLQ